MDAEQFKRIFVPLNASLYRVAFHYLATDEEARDVVQDVYVKLWNQRKNLDAIANPEAYALRTAANLSIDCLRRKSNVLFEDVEQVSETLTDEADQVKIEDVQFVLECIEQLPQRQREVIRLAALENKDYKFIAEQLHITELKHDSATTGHTALYRVAGIAATVVLVVCLGLGFALREPQPKETYDNPEMAYAQLESTMSLLAQTLNSGMNNVHKFDPMVETVSYITGKQHISNNKKHKQ